MSRAEFLVQLPKNGSVVRDIQAAMRHWMTVLGVGPWFYVERAPIENFQYYGEPSPVEVSIALANSGPLQIELTQQAPRPRYHAASKKRLLLFEHCLAGKSSFFRVRQSSVSHRF